MNPLQAGIAAAREGRREEARQLLKAALQADPLSEQGWLWMSAAVENDAERRVCLERVLSINPQNQTAQAGLEQLALVIPAGAGGQAYPPMSPRRQDRGATPGLRTDKRVSQSPSRHSQPTLGMHPAVPQRRSIRRLAPQANPLDEWAALRPEGFEAPPDSDEPSGGESDPFMALILIGGLSLTAIAGALMLGVLLLIGWPP